MKKLFSISLLTISFVAFDYLGGNSLWPLVQPTMGAYLQSGKAYLQCWLAELSDSGNAATKIDVMSKPPQQDFLQQQAQSQLMAQMATISANTVPLEPKLAKEQIKQYRQDYEQADNSDDKRAALVALVELDKRNALPLLENAYRDQDAGLRLEAVEQLLAFNQQDRAVKILLSALNDPDPNVVMEAIEGLANNSDKKVISGLSQIAANHPDQLIREVAADYLSQARDFAD